MLCASLEAVCALHDVHHSRPHSTTSHTIRTPGQRGQPLRRPLLHLRHRLLGRQLQGRRLLQERPTRHYQQVEPPPTPPPSAAPPRGLLPRSHPRFLRTLHSLVAPPHATHPTVTAPHFLQHTAVRPKATGTLARTFTMASKPQSRCAPYPIRPPALPYSLLLYPIRSLCVPDPPLGYTPLGPMQLSDPRTQTHTQRVHRSARQQSPPS